MENNERELDISELDRVLGGYQHTLGNPHPFEETEIYGKGQKEKLEELKRQLEELEQGKNSGRSR